jgi:hypothetical protein
VQKTARDRTHDTKRIWVDVSAQSVNVEGKHVD